MINTVITIGDRREQGIETSDGCGDLGWLHVLCHCASFGSSTQGGALYLYVKRLSARLERGDGRLPERRG